jgi:tRNA(Arg) A34 adenosine deaminase TadA
MQAHDRFMHRCAELAALAAAEGESPVGSVVVKNGTVLGEGYEKSRQLKDITRHAEVVAILDAVQKGHDCTGAILYSTTEPCLLCSYVIRHHRIATLVFSSRCGELGGTRPGYGLLQVDTVSSWGAPPAIILYHS